MQQLPLVVGHINEIRSAAEPSEPSAGSSKPSAESIGLPAEPIGLVNCIAEFKDQPKVINGYSELMKEVFGDDAGVGARSAVGAIALPSGPTGPGASPIVPGGPAA